MFFQSPDLTAGSTDAFWSFDSCATILGQPALQSLEEDAGHCPKQWVWRRSVLLYIHWKWCMREYLQISALCVNNVSVTYVTLVPWRRERRRHVGWPTKLGSRQRDLSTSSVTKRANGHWHAIIASSCRWSPREYKRQQVHRINSCFRWGAEPVTRQLSGGTATVATGLTSPFPPSGNEGYIRNRDVPFQSVTRVTSDDRRNWDPYQSATGAAPSSALCRPPDPSYKADDRTGLYTEKSTTVVPWATQTVGLG